MNQQQQLDKGLALARKGHLKSAVKVWLAGLQAAASLYEEVQYWAVLGAQIRQAGQIEQALAMHTHALQLSANDRYLQSLLQLHLGLDLIDLSQPDLALRALHKAHDFPDIACCPILQELISQIHAHLGDYAQARVALELAIELYADDDLAQAHCSLALLQLYAQRPAVEDERLVRAIEIACRHLHLLEGDRQQMLIELGRACRIVGHEAQAADYFGQALALAGGALPTQHKPRRLSAIEFKLQQITNEIEIELLREKNAAQHQQVQQLETVGFRDEITGLYNPRYFSMRWDALLRQAEGGKPVCLLSIGIDLYASISEVLGKEAALLIYIQIAQILQAECPADAILMTSGTGAFELLVLDMPKQQIEEMMARVQQHMSTLEQGHLPEPLGISIGGAYYQPGETRDIFQLRANLALFLAQRKEMNEISWDGEL
ncbi:diguanylate cyclase [Chitinibacter sp. FCG-7]|uniref:Diguanylate cyclase n=1 Tax=Chitinibacter mangrovi TaxID=3153927 RepID=A0AAU7FDN3_9NEIS